MRRNRVLLYALAFSLVFHLSMVTLFRIVLYFPVAKVEYFNFRIVEARADERPAGIPREELTLSGPAELFERIETARAAGGDLPAIELPRLEFSELELLREGAQGLQIRSKYRELFQQRPDDSWARFSRRLDTLGQGLAGLARGLAAPGPPRRIPVSRPAPGFEAHLEWFTEPRGRQPLFVAAIEALRGRDPAVLREPLVLTFKVDREGRTIEVLAPLEDEEGIVDNAAKALFAYRFEPLGADGPETQTGTLVIVGEGAAP